ncbi:predicted protein [Nematostella vectensis]|uniref:Protein NDRG3 n=1 Tax=Nematostella vectensis TaxID=45351 RepID=A7SUY2_NEMVE|nr:predicted protein [Nematostella vectensis]|eukprot:XP_001624593.1 predicted protein [Nematostella vectensis]
MSEETPKQERVEKVGDLTVYIEGEEAKDKTDEKENVKKKDVMITFHDLGMNHKTCFEKFLMHEDIKSIKDRFVIYHLDAPGQETGAENLSNDYQYPTINELADMVGKVLDHFALDDVVCFGVGSGANILCHLALASKWKERILGLILVEPCGATSSFKEWGEAKVKKWQLNAKGFTEGTANYLKWHHFERKTGKPNIELMENFCDEMKKNINPHNLAAFLNSYMHRPNILNEAKQSVKDKSVSTTAYIMVVTGEHSPHKEQSEQFFRVLSPVDRKKYSILKPDCGTSVLEEKPDTMAEGLLLFIQGLGLVPTLRTRSMSRTSSFGSTGRTASMSDD